ncbi:antigen -like protein [Brachionus plicatilis]|uniref:Antigen-like protein n=1 Tax=Brachionus plicatilis TaxID=10195 RepID=A0A3M7R0B4_BRAPC|nr:antigen -like protein [Brachionus plicatilis]
MNFFNKIKQNKIFYLIEDKSAYKLAESVETTGHTAYESTVRPLNVIYDSVVSEPEIARESKITPSVSEGTPIVANVLVQKYERELKERELREQEERDREQREREAKERVEFEHKMREQREQEIREQRQREEREARERLEFEEKMREQREVEERREREAEQKMREQRQRELQEREEFERKLKEQEERERVERIEREKELRVKEEREKEQRDREREMARLEFERKIREKREREERDASEAQAALAALTTIIVTDNQESSSNKKLLQVQDEIVTTTLTTNQVYHIQTEDNQESINQVTLEPNNEMIVTDYHATYVQEDDQVQYDSASQISDEEEQRRQLAGNYTNSLIYNVSNETPADKDKSDDSFTLSSHKAKPLSDDLLHLIDASSDQSGSSDHVYFKRKSYLFEKEGEPTEPGYKQPSLAQIIQSLNRGLDLSLSESSEANSMQESYAPPYSIGIRLRQKHSPLEIGDHVISHVEPGGLADKAGVKKNSRLVSINDTSCDDKTHEFVVFFLNYVLRKNSCTKIVLGVEEPVRLEQIASKEQVNYITEAYRIENANLRAIVRNILTGEEFTPVGHGPLENVKQVAREAKQVASSDAEYHELERMVSRPEAAAAAADSSGIENLKSIIRQIKFDFEQHVEPDDELETPIHIDTLQLKQSADGLHNLKTILQQAIDRNDFYLNSSQFLLLRGILK